MLKLAGTTSYFPTAPDQAISWLRHAPLAHHNENNKNTKTSIGGRVDAKNNHYKTKELSHSFQEATFDCKLLLNRYPVAPFRC